MTEKHKHHMSGQSGGKGGSRSGGASGGGATGASSKTDKCGAGHENGAGQIYAQQGFGVNEAMSEPARDDAVLEEGTGGAGSSGGGGVDMDAGGQPGGVPGQAVAEPGVNIDPGHTVSGRKG